METNKEIEVKFSFPSKIDEEKLMGWLRTIVRGESWQISSDRTARRSFLYYDTPLWEIYRKGETLRRVGGFDIKKGRGGFRYDYKTGKIDCRLETKSWSDEILSSKKIIQELNLPFKQVVPSVPVETYHRLLDIEKGITRIELKLDDYNLFGGVNLRELELEIMQGDELELKEISGKLQRRLDLTLSKKQKYTQIVDLKGLRRNQSTLSKAIFFLDCLTPYGPF